MKNLIIQRDFDPQVAKDVDTDAAIILQNIIYWIGYNIAQGKEDHYHDNKWWTYSSAKAFTELFPYLTKKQIETRINKLEEEGYIVKGNFNENKYDKTTWLSIGEKYQEIYKSLLPNGNIDVTEKSHRSYQKVTPIPNDKPNDNTYIEKITIGKNLTKIQKQEIKKLRQSQSGFRNYKNSSYKFSPSENNSDFKERRRGGIDFSDRGL